VIGEMNDRAQESNAESQFFSLTLERGFVIIATELLSNLSA